MIVSKCIWILRTYYWRPSLFLFKLESMVIIASTDKEVWFFLCIYTIKKAACHDPVTQQDEFDDDWCVAYSAVGKASSTVW